MKFLSLRLIIPLVLLTGCGGGDSGSANDTLTPNDMEKTQVLVPAEFVVPQESDSSEPQIYFVDKNMCPSVGATVLIHNADGELIKEQKTNAGVADLSNIPAGGFIGVLETRTIASKEIKLLKSIQKELLTQALQWSLFEANSEGKNCIEDKSNIEDKANSGEELTIALERELDWTSQMPVSGISLFWLGDEAYDSLGDRQEMNATTEGVLDWPAAKGDVRVTVYGEIENVEFRKAVIENSEVNSINFPAVQTSDMTSVSISDGGLQYSFSDNMDKYVHADISTGELNKNTAVIRAISQEAASGSVKLLELPQSVGEGYQSNSITQWVFQQLTVEKPEIVFYTFGDMRLFPDERKSSEQDLKDWYKALISTPYTSLTIESENQ